MSVRARVSSGDPVTSDISRSPQAPCPPTNSQVTALHHDLAAPLTLTASLVDAISHTTARIRDTRKTVPGLRLLQKYAVRCGGGVNHRMGLGDEALIKDNHVIAAGGIAVALAAVRAAAPDLPLEVECDTLDQVAAAIDAGARLILLDNMALEQMRDAVAKAHAVGGVRLEASGGLILQR